MEDESDCSKGAGRPGTNYEEADPGERKVALDKLVAYHRAPPSAGIRVAFEEWLDRRRKDAATASSKLVADLDKALAKF